MDSSMHSGVGNTAVWRNQSPSEPLPGHMPYLAGSVTASVIGLLSILSIGATAPLSDDAAMQDFLALVSMLGLAMIIALALLSIGLRLVTERFASLHGFVLGALATTVLLSLLRVAL